MTIISSGQLALQNAGTNPTTTADNIPLSTSITPGVDTTASIWRYMEAPYGDNFANTRQWDGTIYGWAASSTYLESGTNVSGRVFNTILGNVGGTSAGNCWFNETSTQMGGTSNGNTFVDSSGTTRTITAALWGIPNSTSPSPNNNTRWFLLAINGTSVPNSDNTFDKVVFSSATGSAGSTFDRTGATVRSSSDNGSTVWLWEYDTTNAYNSIDYGLGANSTAKTFKVHLAQTTVSLNNGIAEEMGGADSSNVTMSHYFAGGTYTPSGIDGIPTAGSQIKFSDFFGKTYNVSHGTVIVPDFFTYGGGYVYYTNSGYDFQGYSGETSTITDANFPNTGTISFGGLTRNANDIQITRASFFNVNDSTNAGIFALEMRDYSSDRGTTWTNTGWDTLEVYLDQSNDSGTPDFTFAREDASFTKSTFSTSMQGAWTWAGTYGLFSAAMGNSTTPSTNGNQFIKITGMS